MEKIGIIGSSGAGKTTVAQELSLKMKIPYFEPDTLIQVGCDSESGCNPLPSVLVELLEKERWIVEGIYHDSVLDTADTIIFLDYATSLSLKRAVQKSFSPTANRPEKAINRLTGKIDLKQLRDIQQYNTTERPLILKKLTTLRPTKKVIVLTTQSQKELLLSSIPQA